MLFVWDRKGLYAGCAHQGAAGQRQQRSDLNIRECLAALQQPGARAERERGPLERELRDVAEWQGAVGAEGRADRHHIRRHTATEQSVGAAASERVPVCSDEPEQQRPCGDREVVHHEAERVSKRRLRRLVGMQPQLENLLHGVAQRRHGGDDPGRGERGRPDPRVGPQECAYTTPGERRSIRPLQLCGSHCSTA
jgi:hypothetical protein